jgi:hypothetical protein
MTAACERFVEELLKRGFRIEAFKHEELGFPKHEFESIGKDRAAVLAIEMHLRFAQHQHGRGKVSIPFCCLRM